MASDPEPNPPVNDEPLDDPLVASLEEGFGEAIESSRSFAGELTIEVRRESIAEVCAALKERHGFTYLVDVYDVERPEGEPRCEVVYLVHSFEAGRRVRLRVSADEGGLVPGVAEVWRGAGLPREDREGSEGASGPEEMEVSFGPRHPSLQGVLRLRIVADGERIVEAEPVGLRRGEDFEVHPLTGEVPFAGRLDVAAGLAYVGAIEKMLGLDVPPRARLLRTVFAELQRIASHLQWLAGHAADVGAVAPSAPALRERERVLDLLQDFGGLRPGGLARDVPEGWAGRCRAVAEGLPARLDGIEGMLTDDRLWKKRTVGTGVLDPETAVDFGVTGPMLRASGVASDLRRSIPYEAYSEVEFEVPVGKTGDVYDRYLVRVAEVRQSARIVVQVLDGLSEGASEGSIAADLPKALEIPADAEVYHAVEGPRGEVGFHLRSDGTTYRCRVRPPSFANLQALPELCRGARIADLVALVGTVDAAPGEHDR